MAWEWVPAVSAAGGASVGAVTTWLAARGGRKHAETIAAQNHAHAERMTRQERQQKRLEAAYIEVLTSVERFGHWANRVSGPIKFELGPPQELPEPPSRDELTRTRALAHAYGSSQVNDLLSQYIEAVDDIARHVRALTIMTTAKNIGVSAQDYLEMEKRIHEEFRPAESARRKRLAEQVAAELNA